VFLEAVIGCIQEPNNLVVFSILLTFGKTVKKIRPRELNPGPDLYGTRFTSDRADIKLIISPHRWSAIDLFGMGLHRGKGCAGSDLDRPHAPIAGYGKRG
jgi:hypothetical protein